MTERPATYSRFAVVRADQRPRARLLDEIVRMASGVGLAKITVSELCRAVGVPRRTFYRYFADVPGAFLAAQLELHRDLRTAIHVAYSGATDPPQRALACIDALVTFVRADPVRAAALFVEGPTGGIAVDAIRAETVEWAIELVMGATCRPDLVGLHPWDRPADDTTHRLLAEVAVGGINAVVWRQVVRGDLDRLADATPYLVEAVLRPYEWARRRG